MLGYLAFGFVVLDSSFFTSYPFAIILFKCYRIELCGKADLCFKGGVTKSVQKGSKRAAVAGSKVFETDLTFRIAINGKVFLAGISAERGNGAFTNGKAEVVEDAGTAVGGEYAAVGSSEGERSASHGVGQRRRAQERGSGVRISDC